MSRDSREPAEPTAADIAREIRAQETAEKQAKEKLDRKKAGQGCLILIALIVLVSIIIAVSTGGDNADEQALGPPAAFQVINRNDISNKALERPLSAYSVAEIEALPTARRETVDAIIDGPITQEQIEPTLHAILDAIRAADSDTDEITVWLYSDADRIGLGWDIGRLLWAPGGEMGNITAHIASSNDRSTYAVAVDVRDNVEAYLANRTEASVRHGMTAEARRAYYRALWDLEGVLMLEADAQIDPIDDFEGNLALYDELLDAGRAQLQLDHGVTAEAHSAILQEAIEKGW